MNENAPVAWQDLVEYPPWNDVIKPLLTERYNIMLKALARETDPVLFARYQGAIVELGQILEAPEKAQRMVDALRRQLDEEEENANVSKRRAERGWQLFHRR